MDKSSSQTSKKGMIAALAGTVLVALCCFTPILVILLGAVGLSVFTPYLDFVLLPALCIMIALSLVSFMRWRKSAAINNTSSRED
ncbi:Membrane transport protein MerF [Olavius algarvensis Delta 1 endosymbiont]|nr:Membrane transport protein MerF [Olavius algarvensis Delta 1 endosymbiont]